jgi:phosphatidylglycerol:prolipoprotein diacylglycerol transferase
VGLWYVRKHRLPVWPVADAVAPSIALGHVVGRFGCLLAGCCYGKPTSLPWGITFTDPFAASNVGTPLHVALHPTQMYDAGAEFLILVLLLATERFWRRHAGWTFWVYILLYGISRPLSFVMLYVLSRTRPSAVPAAAAAPHAPPARRKKHGR